MIYRCWNLLIFLSQYEQNIPWQTLNFYHFYHLSLQQPIMHQCPFLEVNKHHEWIYMGPVFLLLATNAFFLVSIFYVVVTKLRSTGKNYLGEDGLPSKLFVIKKAQMTSNQPILIVSDHIKVSKHSFWSFSIICYCGYVKSFFYNNSV